MQGIEIQNWSVWFDTLLYCNCRLHYLLLGKLAELAFACSALMFAFTIYDIISHVYDLRKPLFFISKAQFFTCNQYLGPDIEP